MTSLNCDCLVKAACGIMHLAKEAKFAHVALHTSINRLFPVPSQLETSVYYPEDYIADLQ